MIGNGWNLINESIYRMLKNHEKWQSSLNSLICSRSPEATHVQLTMIQSTKIFKCEAENSNSLEFLLGTLLKEPLCSWQYCIARRNIWNVEKQWKLKGGKNPFETLKYLEETERRMWKRWMFETKTRWKTEKGKSHPLCNSLLYLVPLPVEAPLVLALYIFTQTNLLKGLMSTEE